MSESEEIEEFDDLPGKPLILSRNEHSISRRNIDTDALKVMRRLNGFGYQAFLVGGGVRDLLLNKKPKDFDIGTSARPEEVKDLFRNSRIIGKRFKLVHVYFKGGKIIEVSTFRARHEDEGQTLAADNTYGDAESDALRRDLTINGLFYDSRTFSIIDYVGGIKDLEKNVVRVIGEPSVRFKEDPVRIIRAARHAARAGFRIQKKTADAMKSCVGLLAEVPSSRLYEELTKDFYSGSFHTTFKSLSSFGVVEQLMPFFAQHLSKSSKTFRNDLEGRLSRLDSLVNDGKDPLQELFFCVFLIDVFQSKDLLKEDLVDEEVAQTLEQITRKAYSDSDSAALYKKSKIKLIPKRSKARSRDRATPLAKALSSWFAPLVLTKREKNAAERLMVLRYRFLCLDKETLGDDFDQRREQLEEVLHSLHEEEIQHLHFLLYVIGDPLTEDQEKILKACKKIKKPKRVVNKKMKSNKTRNNRKPKRQTDKKKNA